LEDCKNANDTKFSISGPTQEVAALMQLYNLLSSSTITDLLLTTWIFERNCSRMYVLS